MRESQASPIRFHLAFATLGLAFLAMFSWVFAQEYFAEWRQIQAEFAELQQGVKDPQAVDIVVPLGEVRQIWLPDLDRVDRCTTCHLGIDDPDFGEAPQPFATHSGEWLRTHAPDDYGCTACHGGQGEATDFVHAAHQMIPGWSDVMRPAPLIEANCGTCHRERNPPAATWLARGRQVIADAGCVACHDIPGFNVEEVHAPLLDSIGYKVQANWLEEWLTDPASYLSQARMPNFRLEPNEIESLSAFLLAQRETPPLDSSHIDWEGGDPDQGRVVFREARCVSCHMIDGRGGTMGPELTFVGSKVHREWLVNYIQDPMHYQPDTLMVRYRFTDEEIRDLVTYLTGELIDPSAPDVPVETRNVDQNLVEAGRDVFVDHGCHNCHGLTTSESGKIGPSLVDIGDRAVEPQEFEGQAVVPTLANWVYLKLRDPERLTQESKMPTYGLTEQDAAAAVVALLSIHDNDLSVSRVTNSSQPPPYEPQGAFGALMSRYRCLSCHQVRGWGSELSTVPLDRIGSQLQRSYLVSYLQLPSAVRVNLEARMPHFHMTPEEAEILAAYMSRVFVDDRLERTFEPDAEAARRGAHLFKTLGCQGCHIVGGEGGYVGPDLGDSGRRLKPGWIQAWLAEPERWKPGTLQPNYDLAPEDVGALSEYLMTLSTEGGGMPQ